MKLSWKDGVATAITGLVVAIYALCVSGAEVVFLSSARGAAVVILLLGVIGCGYGAADQLYKTTRSGVTRTYSVIMAVLGVAALGGGLTAIIFSSQVALTVLFVATVALWLFATTRHIANTCRAPRVVDEATPTRKEETSL